MFGMGRIKLFRAFGIDVEAHWSLLLALLLFSWTSSLALALAVFASVLVHEFGHSLLAQRLGVRIAGIELHFFGGVAKMIDLPKTPRDEILIAAAGPLTSFVLGIGAYFLGITLQSPLLLTLASVNLVLAVFNLLPALPMDGGRIFRAALQTKLGGYQATKIAATVARGLAVVMALYGWYAGMLMLPVLAVLLWIMSGQELAFAEMRFGAPAAPKVEVLDADEPDHAPPYGGRPAQADGLGQVYAGMVQAMLDQMAARGAKPGQRRRVIMRDSKGRIIMTEEGTNRW